MFPTNYFFPQYCDSKHVRIFRRKTRPVRIHRETYGLGRVFSKYFRKYSKRFESPGIYIKCLRFLIRYIIRIGNSKCRYFGSKLFAVLHGTIEKKNKNKTEYQKKKKKKENNNKLNRTFSFYRPPKGVAEYSISILLFYNFFLSSMGTF